MLCPHHIDGDLSLVTGQGAIVSGVLEVLRKAWQACEITTRPEEQAREGLRVRIVEKSSVEF
jgi:hypothetical protein